MWRIWLHTENATSYYRETRKVRAHTPHFYDYRKARSVSSYQETPYCRADRVHARLYAHPARCRYEQLPSGFTPMVYRKDPYMTIPPWPDANPRFGLLDPKMPSDAKKLEELIAEVKSNGYDDDLLTADGESVLTVVDRKLAHPLCPKSETDLQGWQWEWGPWKPPTRAM